MKFTTFQYGNKISAGIIQGSIIIDLAIAFFKTFRRPFKFVDLRDFLSVNGVEKIRELDWGAIKSDNKASYRLRDVELKAPILRPPKIIAVGLNYKDHAAEQNIKPPSAPLLFAKAANTVIGNGDAIEIPYGISTQIDYEVELAIIIGKDCHKISKEEAISCVFGFTILNDITARDIQSTDKQWYRAKSFATFAPMGPIVITPDELDYGNLNISLTLNGEMMQNANTNNLIFDIPSLISYISHCHPLEIGDVISTGTPAGVGVFRKPPVFLKAGDELISEVEGIGILRNTVK